MEENVNSLDEFLGLMIEKVIQDQHEKGNLIKVDHVEIEQELMDELREAENENEERYEIVWKEIKSKIGVEEKSPMLMINKETNMLEEVAYRTEEGKEVFDELGIEIRSIDEVMNNPNDSVTVDEFFENLRDGIIETWDGITNLINNKYTPVETVVEEIEDTKDYNNYASLSIFPIRFYFNEDLGTSVMKYHVSYYGFQEEPGEKVKSSKPVYFLDIEEENSLNKYAKTVKAQLSDDDTWNKETAKQILIAKAYKKESIRMFKKKSEHKSFNLK